VTAPPRAIDAPPAPSAQPPVYAQGRQRDPGVDGRRAVAHPPRYSTRDRDARPRRPGRGGSELRRPRLCGAELFVLLLPALLLSVRLRRIRARLLLLRPLSVGADTRAVLRT